MRSIILMQFYVYGSIHSEQQQQLQQQTTTEAVLTTTQQRATVRQSPAETVLITAYPHGQCLHFCNLEFQMSNVKVNMHASVVHPLQLDRRRITIVVSAIQSQ